MPRLKLTDDEARLVTRYREQASAYNDGLSAALAAVTTQEFLANLEDAQAPALYELLTQEILKLRKDHG